MFQSRNPNYNDYVKLKVARNKFLAALGFELTLINEGAIEGELVFKEMHEQQNGFFHGGVISTLCDMACGYSAYSLVEEGQQVFTVELKVSYLRKGIGEKLIAKGRVIKPGKKFYFCESEVYAVNSGETILVAKASSTMSVGKEKVNDKYGG